MAACAARPPLDAYSMLPLQGRSSSPYLLGASPELLLYASFPPPSLRHHQRHHTFYRSLPPHQAPHHPRARLLGVAPELLLAQAERVVVACDIRGRARARGGELGGVSLAAATPKRADRTVQARAWELRRFGARPPLRPAPCADDRVELGGLLLEAAQVHRLGRRRARHGGHGGHGRRVGHRGHGGQHGKDDEGYVRELKVSSLIPQGVGSHRYRISERDEIDFRLKIYRGYLTPLA